MGTDRRDRWLAAVAWTLSAFAAAELIATLWSVWAVRVSLAEAVDSYLLTNTAMGSGFAVSGAVLAVQRTRNPVGWLLLLAGIAHLSTAAAVGVGQAVGATVDEWVVRSLLTVLNVAWPWGIGLFLPLALQLFPTGRPVSPRWWWLVVATVAFGVLFAAGMNSAAVTIIDGRSFTPFVMLPPSERWAGLWWVANGAPLFGLVGSIMALVVRYRRGTEQARRQLLWLVLAMIIAIGLNLPRFFLADAPISPLLAVALVPVAITVAILRYQLLDIRLVVSRAALYLVLTAAVIGVYAGLLAIFDSVLRGAGAPLLATLLIALAFNPARVWLQRRVDRLFYGSRSDPVRALSQVGARLAADDLAGVLDGIRDALRLPFAALEDSGGHVAQAGQLDGPRHIVPLSFHGTAVGELVVGVRRGERALSGADQSVLALLAAPLAATLHATALATEVQASRERIVAAREEERRRLHRELHDGLGPTLTGAGFKADAARNFVAGTSPRVDDLLVELRRDIGDAIASVRQIVYGLRPPALDDLGLVGALRRHADTLPLTVTLIAPDPLPPLPAAVEVAAYRIAAEALTNVARHANATTAAVTVTTGSALGITVADNGPSRAIWVHGVGLDSMHERAAELGGHCSVGSTESGGKVLATLPVTVTL